MALPWVRLDSNIASHDKMLDLLGKRPAATAFQAAASYMFGLGYAGGHGTDGEVPFAALGFIHGTRRTAELLVEVGLWLPTPTGWAIRNYDQRQELSGTTSSRHLAAVRANCVRWHGPGCVRCGSDSESAIGSVRSPSEESTNERTNLRRLY